jgi:hypothetical protein
MATLFFEGFDKGVVFNELDPKYWSSQFKYFPKYAFGGYAPTTIEDQALDGIFGNNIAVDKLSFLYKYSTPTSINGLVPSGRYTDNRASYSFLGTTYYTKNSYPGFGSPPGFLAFTNIELENSTSVEYPTYLQASGFPVSTGSISYLSMRCLGLESKHTDYSSYPHRHTLFSFNSGDLSSLTVNVVKISGDNLLPINGKKETLALEIQQNDQTLGYFDLNLSGTIGRYQISSVFNTSNNKILTITDSNRGDGFSFMISRWCHLEFSVDKTTSPPLLYINAEDINLSVVNTNPEIAKESWDTSLPISGFNFNNLRFYNRTYSSAVMNGVTPSIQGEENWKDSWYYMRGRVWLLDDLALVDNTDPPPSYWLGSSAKVMSVYPGVSGSLIDNYGSSDGLLKWYKDPAFRTVYRRVIGDGDGDGGTRDIPYEDYPSHRRAFLIPDADGNYVEAIESGNIDAVKMSRPNYLSNVTWNSFDADSVWRGSFNDAIGGMKVYNSARKKYLDTKFINVLYSGQSDIYEPNITLLLHGDSNPIVDNSTNPRSFNIYGSTISTASFSKMGVRSISFPNQDSYIYLDYPDLSTSPFTIESWVYFTNNTTSISLFDKIKVPEVDIKRMNYPEYDDSRYYSFSANISGIQFISDRLATFGSRKTIRQLIFPINASTGVWHHVAITRNSTSGIVCFLNGQSGVSHKITNSGNPGILGFPDTAGTFNTLYTLPTYEENIFSYFDSSYPINPYLTIGKGGYIDEYRITSGINRYPTNFSVPTSAFKTKADDYVEIGPQHNVTKTSYRTYQYYVNQNPITQQNWTLPEVTGLIFGVKKL